MAEAAATHSVDALPSPSSVNGKEQQPWDFSVPISQEQNAHISTSSKPRTSNDSTATFSKSSQRHNQPPAVNGTALSRNSSRSGSRQGDQGYLLPNRVDALGRRDPSLSRTGSEADSLLELYGRDSANRSAVSVMESGDKKSSDKHHPTFTGDELDNANWIHRDKLAKIESEELQQFGIQFHQRQVRAGSKSSSRRGRSHDSHSNGINGTVPVEQGDQQWHGPREEKRQRITSPAPVEDVEQEGPEESEPMIFDPRLPEEIAADPYENGGSASQIYRQPGLRKSSSRIPVLATSPHPIPLEHLEREFPLPRTRNNTLGSGDDDSISYAKSRKYSDPVPAAADDTPQREPGPEPEFEPEPQPQAETTPPSSSRRSSVINQAQSSPVKSKTPGTKQTTGRKSSVPPNNRKSSGGKSKATASGSSSSNQRPSTRSGENRPQTAVNRPEGDPPWLATMYKPDPRLPPDQQILPTHARRLQQEQWEREGKVASTFDREFAPLAVQDFGKPIAPTLDIGKAQETSASSLWPPTPKSPDLNHRPSTSGTDHGGYKTIPTVQSAPSPNPSHGSKPKQPRPTPVQDSPPAKEKGCGCCIVM
ncbi:hypothetical protein FQN51_003209 [Onygenales sp. PD_10]|nr:hypothetical protein FQN51_003209 [Onygenales sp. PD_10]